MNILLQLVSFILGIFIYIGDFVISVGIFIASHITRFKNLFFKKRLNGTFNLPKAKRIKKSKNPRVSLITLGKSTVIYIFLKIIGIVRAVFRYLSDVFQEIKKAVGKRPVFLTRKKKGKKIKKVPSFFYKLRLIFLGFILASGLIFLPILALIFLGDLPSLSELSVSYIPKTTKIYDKNGALLYEIYANQNRTIVKLSEIPENLIKATIAIEDKDFYKHPGFDIKAIVRALWVDITRQGFEGGSTITQQLIKSAFLTPDPSIARKLKEIALAFLAEKKYTKNQILELYFNYVPYGGSAWGIQSAADIYFNKKTSELSLAQSAFLAGLPRAPSIYSPYFGEGDLWKRRQKEVLNAMVREKYITQKEAEEAYGVELRFQTLSEPIKAPHFVMYIREILVNKYGLGEVERGGLQVRTTLDLELQDKTEDIVRQEVESNARLNIGNGAALVTDPTNGDILAMVGSKDYFDRDNDGNVNLTTSLRQPGSTIKLVTYSLALSNGFTEASILNDSPLTIRNAGEAPYSPVNYDGIFHGNVTLRAAFANSFNIPAVRTAQKLGVDNIVRFGQEMGISSWKIPNDYGLSITLGGADVTMIDLATAFGTIANQGSRVDLDPILEIKDSSGNTVYKKNVNKKKVVDSGVAFIISDILSDNNARRLEFGLNTPLNIPGKKVSVKTGTTDNKRDNWTIGYTPEVLVSTWVGNNDNSPMNQALASGISGAAPMWNRIISTILEENSQASVSAQIPDNVIKKFCLGQDRYFIKGTEISASCKVQAAISPTLVP
ncbi:MAG: hypothetical protein COU27_02485 [Candidatus Levybacteria bacterium CG10_big_fil_rev_8_21_14_0_10_36_7]|nr:MAG: hypothetical protein COU27_02485 [Candidatus Levybacteria bacterium CG10_big_fil_rev_8_21_14_0_10_36_7]